MPSAKSIGAEAPPTEAHNRSVIPRIALTCGEPAGIGPELVVKLAQSPLDAGLVAIGNAALLADTARALALPLEILDARPESRVHAPGTLRVMDIPLAAPVRPGVLDPRNAAHVVETLARASDGALSRDYDAIVTAPVSKGVIADAGTPFTGHTEFFAQRARREVVMLLAAPRLRVALATTHLPLAEVPRAISRDVLDRTLSILVADLRGRFGIDAPRIAVLGLNPHAGEGGHLGREELDLIAPVCEAWRARGAAIEGPLSADTAFVPSRRERFDAYLAMYHDQGLPVLKALGFGDAVNVTLGLPYVRTSVDHGIALDLAGRGVADASSLAAAMSLAIALARPRTLTPGPSPGGRGQQSGSVA
jgi:4-hydroxythreonine-4-phosphate dehydrogenase